MVNPYDSPSSPCYNPARPGQVGTLLLGLVFFNLGWNALKVFRNWPEMPLELHLVCGVLWFGLPTLSAFLLWRRWRIGRWMLVGQFGLLVVANLAILGQYVPFVLESGAWGLLFARPQQIVEILLYLGATVWLIFSPTIRSHYAVATAESLDKQ